MGNDHTKQKSAKAQSKPVVSRGKSLDNTKNVLLLYKASLENEKTSSDVVDHFCDALNQVKPPGCVAIESENAVNLFEQDEQNIRNRTSQWLANPNCVVIVLCLGENDLSRECFTDESGILPNKIFPVCFGTLEWPESYSLGLANPEKIERPNDFEGAGFDTLVAAIRGTK